MSPRARSFRLIKRYHPRYDGTALITFSDNQSLVRSLVVYHAQIMAMSSRPCGQLLIHGWINQACYHSS